MLLKANYWTIITISKIFREKKKGEEWERERKREITS